MTDAEQVWMALRKSQLDEAETRGFDDGTSYALNRVPRVDHTRYYKPPEGAPGCGGCAADQRGTLSRACLRCRYTEGFCEGAGK